MKCCGCDKELPKGDFVVLGGGALKKTRTGAVADSSLLGFFSVTNHFDSTNNHRSFYFADSVPGGQFEFYACSHKCLIKYLTVNIERMAKLDKAIKEKKIFPAPTVKIKKISDHYLNETLKLIGFKNVFVTDWSTIGDFLSFEMGEKETKSQIAKFSLKLGFPVKESDRIWEVAKKYQDKFLGISRRKV